MRTEQDPPGYQALVSVADERSVNKSSDSGVGGRLKATGLSLAILMAILVGYGLAGLTDDAGKRPSLQKVQQELAALAHLPLTKDKMQKAAKWESPATRAQLSASARAQEEQEKEVKEQEQEEQEQEQEQAKPNLKWTIADNKPPAAAAAAAAPPASPLGAAPRSTAQQGKQAQAGGEIVEVRIPAGVVAGQEVEAQVPQHGVQKFIVPPGAVAGQVVEIRV